MVWVPGDSLPRQLLSAALDVVTSVGYAGRLLPPFSMRRYVGEARWDLAGRDFLNTGQHIVEKLQLDAALRAENRVLDVGSGCGRIAIPLTRIIRSPGLYRGLELNKTLVRWCNREIGARYPEFAFIQADVQNPLYNPTTRIDSREYKFPFEAATFDLIVATSLFTHLLPEVALNYIAECARVLSVGGRIFATFFLVEEATSSTDGRLHYRHPVDSAAFCTDPSRPQRGVAYKPEWVVSAFKSVGLELLPPFRWGAWSGRATAPYSGQDVVILQKRTPDQP
jgi:SAM-dependent methyltransferase